MASHKSCRHTCSDDLTSKENLDKFYEEHIKFLLREKKRLEKFFRENGISGENLEIKLRELERIIEERIQLRENIQYLKLTQGIAYNLINELHAKKRNLQEEIRQLEQEN
ncbi:2513_t:CDS:1 [Racocetra persica]|uniref:2513_t:CDS:1 n=1 Tax=Racocetra persica TaxID=160502 RepID=A0ACA9LNW5_9GLOM|nr:2513_t:CDS:1 [Racocetra persica]